MGKLAGGKIWQTIQVKAIGEENFGGIAQDLPSSPIFCSTKLSHVR